MRAPKFVMLANMRPALAVKVGRAWYGVSLGRDFLRPDAEAWHDYRGAAGSYSFAQALGVSVWRDTLPPVTVGERGAW